jgi:hypothetical protein
MMMNRRWNQYSIWVCVILIGLIGQARSAGAGDDRWVTLSTVKARPLSMGGAFMSVRDDLAALDMNPAGFSILTSYRRSQAFVFLNTLSPVVFLSNRNGLPLGEAILGSIVRGAALKLGGVQFGLIIGEESLSDIGRLDRDRVFDTNGYTAFRNTTFGVSVSLAPRVSLGFAGEVYSRGEGDERIHHMGYRYGLILQTRHKIQVGLCFVNLPEKAGNERMNRERLADETLNIGISYTPWDLFRIALDIRNVSDEGKGVVREPHVGVEFFPLPHVTLRAGYFREKDSKSETISAGLGIFDGNRLWRQERRFMHPTFGLNAAVLWENREGSTHRWFVVSCVLRI